ncbi:hypothetical protein [Curtobacterium sp. MCBD17_021]|uniref:hypothetical protein n=1 Tax=Curtobacterium sp. MCBD17_021 TaxID=2175665 RepID=UPI0011B6AD11|nr:hypothetical protein [Curtobacterium sp. MCBD17_021]
MPHSRHLWLRADNAYYVNSDPPSREGWRIRHSPFPGNIAQWLHHRDGFGLDTDTKRFVRLLFQPVLIAVALWATNALRTRR